MIKIDLHIHTNNSDGNLSINQVLKLASSVGIQELSITDHDTIKHLKQYKKMEQNYNLRIIPGIEISTNISKMHILGYGIKNFDMIECYLYNLKVNNVEKNIETISILQKQGFDISLKKVMRVSVSNLITHRDIARYLVVQGYVKSYYEAYKKFIGKGTKAYIPSQNYTFEEIIQLIGTCGGISVLAHPYTLNPSINLKELIKYLKELGLTGIEVYNKKHTSGQIMQLQEIAKMYNLVETAGSDFHDNFLDDMGVNVNDDFLDNFHKIMN